MVKRTLRGTNLKRIRKSGFFARSGTSSGKKILRAKRRIGRYSVSLR